MNGNGTAYPPGPSNSGGAGESPASPAFRTNSGRKDVKPTRESRATMACAACRKQKMKCEGGEPGTVCRRCRVQNLECLFEAPAGNLGGRSRNDFSDRLNEVESRLGERLNDLEAQLKSLQHLRVPPQFPEPQQRLPPPTVRSQGLPPAPTPSPAHFYSPQPPTPRSNSIPHPLRPFNPQPHSNSTPHHSFPPHQQQSHPQVAYPQHQSFRASSCASQHTSPADSSTSYRKRGSESGLDEVQLESTLKRIKVAAPVSSPRGAVSDFIARGEIDRDVAFLCFESYLLSINTRLSLNFSDTRERSPLLLTTIIAIGARSLSHACYTVALAEALSLARGTFLSPLEPTTLDLKAMVLLSLYHGLSDIVSWVVDITGRHHMEKSLLRYSRSTLEQQHSADGQRLVRDGRTFLVTWFFAGLYSFVSGNGGSFFQIPAEVIRFQMDTLERSPYSIQPTDRIIRIHVEETLIIHSVYAKLDLSQRIIPAAHNEICSVLDQGLSELAAWHRSDVDAMEMVSTWGDSTELKTTIPLHHGRLTLLRYLFQGPRMSLEEAGSPRVRAFVALGVDSAIGMLRFGVDSKIWSPHSSVANYLNHVNIPLAVKTLDICTRLFPEEADYPLIRSLLHQLVSQLDRAISAVEATAREIQRAHRTKNEVLDFDRFAFEQSGVENPTGNRDTALFGEEITGSILALSQDYSLWGIILIDALSDS